MSQIEINLPDTLLGQLKATAKKEGVSLEQYILFALTRQTMLAPAIRKVSGNEVELQQKNFADRMNRLGRASAEELENVLRERDSVEPEADLDPETVLRLKNRIAAAKNISG